MRAPFSVRMHFSKLAGSTRKGQPAGQSGGRKNRFVAPFLTSYWSLRCLARRRRMDSPLSVGPSSHLHSPLRHLTHSGIRPLPSPSLHPLAYYKCTTTLNSLTPARPERPARPAEGGLHTVTTMTAVIVGDLDCECEWSGVGIRGTQNCPPEGATATRRAEGGGRGGGCACDLRHRHGRRIPHLKANPPERGRSMIETATGSQPVIFCFSLSLSVKKWQSQ